MKQELTEAQMDFRKKIVDHILMMKQFDHDYARFALEREAAMYPELRLNSAVKEAMR